MKLRSLRFPSPVRISNLLYAALACSVGAFVLGARWLVVSRYGMDLPEWDQWDAEGLHLLLPWFQGRPMGPELFAPHNEHYVVLTKLLNLGLTLASGVWDQRLECVVNAFLPASIAIAFLRWSREFTPAASTGFVGLFLAGAWGLPLAWHNVVSGFHSQQFFLIALSFSAIALLPFARPWSLRWCIGAASAALALLSMGSGFFAAAVVIVLLLLRVLLREVSFRNVWPALAVAIALCATGWLTRHEVDYHVVLRARNIQDFVLTVLRGLQWPAQGSPWLAALLWLPWTWLAVRLLFNREKNPLRIHGWILFGLGLWVWLQLIATGYARGAGGPPPATRYLDTLVFGCTVNFLAIGWLRAQRIVGAPRRLALAAVGVAWLVIVAWGVFTETRQALTDHLPAMGHAHRNAIVQTRAYLATGDLAFLDHPDIPYPGASAFAERLAHPELINVLPTSVRPSEMPRTGSGNGIGAARTTETPWLSRFASFLGALGQPVATTAFVALVLLAAACWRVSPREPLHLAAMLFSIRREFLNAPRSSKVTTVLLVLSALGIVLGFVPAGEAAVRPLPAENPGITSTIGDGSWRADTIVPVDAPPSMRRVAVRGSYIDGDTFTGEHVTGWYRADSPVSLMVIGYPRRSPNQLTVEVRLRDGTIAAIPFNGENPAEQWAEWECDIPADAEALRIRGIDATTVWGGWLGFSEPFARSRSQTPAWRMAAKTICTVGLALVLVIGPGLAWRRWRRSGLMSLLWVGPTWLVIGGSACWALGGVIAPSTVAFVWTIGTLLSVGWYSYCHHLWETCTLLEKRVLLLVALCVLGAAAKSAFSGGPRGELYGGTISRTLEVGARSDSRISFHGVQLIAHHLTPYEPEGAKYFAPWLFSSRGPLAGLAAAPVVLATGGRPPLVMPDQPWTPFDPQGFAAYRIVLITLATLALVAVTGMLVRISDERRAWLGAALFALTPFFWHEAYFTWPKLIAAAWVVGAFHALVERKSGRAGLILGGAYLWHPLALLSVPFCGLWILTRKGEPMGPRLGQSALFGATLLAVVIAWQLLNAGHSGQAGFLQYFQSADGAYGVSARLWWLSRWDNAANTLLPFYVFLANSTHPAFNALTESSSAWVHFFLQYWTAAPCGVGLFIWLATVPACFCALGRQPKIGAITLIGPLLLLIFYWGASSTGLMREGAHVLFLTGWIFLVWAAGDRVPSWTTTPAFGVLRGIEILAMMFVPGLMGGIRDNAWILNDIFCLAVTSGCVAASVWIASQPHRQATALPPPSALSQA